MASQIRPGTQYTNVSVSLAGIDLNSPYDEIQKNRSPWATNFRLYAEEADARRVAITSRKGSGSYIAPIGETLDTQNTGTTGATDVLFGVDTPWQAAKFTTASSGRLSAVDVRIKNGLGAIGPVIIEIRADNAGVPGTLLASSGFLSSDIADSYGYLKARFVEAPLVSISTAYWIVAYVQDDGLGTYEWSSTTSGTSYVSTSGGNTWTSNGFGLNFKTYITPDTQFIGVARYTPDTGANKTVLFYGTSAYYATNQNTTLTQFAAGLSGSAGQYYTSQADNRLFWTNNFDQLRSWDSSVTTTTNLVANGEFETNVTGWTGGTNTVVSQDATQFHTGTKSMKLVSSGGSIAQATVAYTYDLFKTYILSMYVKGTAGQQIKLMGSGQLGTAFTLTGGWDLVTFTFSASTGSASTYGIQTVGTNQTLYVDSVSLTNTGIEIITGSNLPVLGIHTFHNNRLFGVSATDPNKLIYSEAPGNGDGTGALWYKAYLSTNFIYVPAPHYNDPITAIISFKNNLYIFTARNKYVLYGSDAATFQLREATGRKGATSPHVVADEEYIYFVSDDGFYRFNGSADQQISTLVTPEFNNIADKRTVAISDWGRMVRFYYATTGKTSHNRTLIWHKDHSEMLLDTDTYVKYALPLTDADDPDMMMEVSSTIPMVTWAEQQYSNLGKSLDFNYWLRYDSFGNPAQRKRIRKLFPLIQGRTGNYYVDVGIDKDMENAPIVEQFPLTTQGLKIGFFKLDGTAKFGGDTSFAPHRVKTRGNGYYWQFRLQRKAINNPVEFMGYALSFRTKKM